MTDWSNDWATARPGYYVHYKPTDVWLAGGWTDHKTGRRRPLIAGVMSTAKRFPDRAAADRAAAYLGNEWEVVEQREPNRPG